MENSDKYAFSENGEYYCNYCEDGKLKVWDTESGVLKQEYTPNLHLSSPCTSLVCLKLSRGVATAKKKRLSTEGGKELHAVALGTHSGQILIYSIASNDVSVLEGGPPSPVKSLSWTRGSNLFSCAGETIVEWNISGKAIKSKWKGGKNTVTCILVLPHEKGLLSATHTITLWSLPEHKRLKTFTGHASDINSMVFIPPTLPNSNSYFISAAKADRYLSAWCLESDHEAHVAQFIMEDTALGISVCSLEETTMAVVARSGVMHLFHVQLNGKCHKPIKPNVTVCVTSSPLQNRRREEICIPIIGGKFLGSTAIIISYGSIPFVVFEKIVPDFSESTLNLVRQDPQKMDLQSKRPISKVVEPEVGNDVEYIGPTMRKSPVVNATNRKRDRKLHSEVPMEERLNNLTLIRSDTSGVPRGENAARLLLQALQSKDKRMIQCALRERDEAIIKRTVSRLPVQVVIQLLQELTAAMHGKVGQCRVAATWIRALITVHASQILASPGSVDYLSPIFGIIDTRLGMLHPLLRLRGRLDLLVDQLSNIHSGRKEQNDADEGLLVYKDSYSSEEESLADEFAGNSEQDENWDEFSEIDEVEEESEKEEGDKDEEMSVE